MRLFLLIFLLALPSPASVVDPSAAIQQGEEALASGLWEIAAMRFDKLLQDPTLSAAQKPRVAIRLAEAWIRSGNPAEALTLLRQSFAAKDPETYFWKAQALAASGRLAESANSFAPALENPQAPYRREAILSRASLQVSLNQPSAALASLKPLVADPDATISAEARIRQAEIHLDQGDTQSARASLPATESIAPSLRPQAAFLNACLLLAESKPDDAVLAFGSLVEQPQGQSLKRHSAAAIGLADALAARGSPAAASKSLLAFIQDHPDEPMLGAMFQRLLLWLPANPTPTDPILEQLSQWSTPLPPSTPGLINTKGSSVVAAWPLLTETSNLAAWAIFTRAIGLQRIPSPEAKSEARRLLTRLRFEHPAHVLATRALLQTGRWLLDDGHTAQALAVLEAVRDSAKSTALGGEADFISAQAAFAQGDPKLAARLFEGASKSLTAQAADTARLNATLARLLIDLNRLNDALTLLRKWNDALPKDDPLRLPVGFLLGEALIAQAETTPALLTEALSIYQKLLTHPQVDPATRYRLQYLRGQTLEQLPSPKNPATKRVAEALEAYYSVLESAAKQPPAEWEWFERCGFRALELCEAAQRWQPAIAIAKKIDSFHGPRAEEAAARARSLQLKHMVWEDE